MFTLYKNFLYCTHQLNKKRMGNKMRINLKNEFHNTRVGINAKQIIGGPYNGLYSISARSVKRSKNTLCGASGCTCGGEFGERTSSPSNIELISLCGGEYIVRVGRNY